MACRWPHQAIMGWPRRNRLFHSTIAQPKQQARGVPGTASGLCKTVEIPTSHMSPQCIAAYPECIGPGIPQSIFRLANHTSDDTANHRPCLIPHWQSSSYQARTVKQSIKRQQGTVGSPEIDSIADPEGFFQKLNWDIEISQQGTRFHCLPNPAKELNAFALS